MLLDYGARPLRDMMRGYCFTPAGAATAQPVEAYEDLPGGQARDAICYAKGYKHARPPGWYLHKGRRAQRRLRHMRTCRAGQARDAKCWCRTLPRHAWLALFAWLSPLACTGIPLSRCGYGRAVSVGE